MNTVFTFVQRISRWNPWIVGAIGGAIPMLFIGVFAILGFAFGSINSPYAPIFGFLTLMCGSVCFFPIVFGLVVGIAFNRVKVALAAFSSLFTRSSHDEPVEPPAPVS